MALFLLVLRATETLLLYSFLGFVLYVLYKSNRNEPIKWPFGTAANLALHIRLEGSSPTQEFIFDNQAHVSIGRDTDNVICLDDNGVSAQHANIFFLDHNWWIEDKASLNGTYLNDEKIIVRSALADGDHVRIGKSILQIKIGTEN